MLWPNLQQWRRAKARVKGASRFLATDQGHGLALMHGRKGERRGREEWSRERVIKMSAMESWKALLLSHSAGYQGINRVLKALRGGRNGGFFLVWGRDRFRMMERQRKRENGRAGQMDVYLACVSPLTIHCHSVHGFASDSRTDSKWAGSEYKGRWLLLLPLVTRRHWALHHWLNYYSKKLAAIFEDLTAWNVNLNK